ncbi:hypothetical protein V5799_033702 [Amblyomma americanum]|uniref:Uncharacterized protein n=1 Tax=Amblyomma americanum TaxID=6943 RepID=A0AAQ4DMJ7_AMBAM
MFFNQRAFILPDTRSSTAARNSQRSLYASATAIAFEGTMSVKVLFTVALFSIFYYEAVSGLEYPSGCGICVCREYKCQKFRCTKVRFFMSPEYSSQ